MKNPPLRARGEVALGARRGGRALLNNYYEKVLGRHRREV
jgi:hypothetical protein